MKINPKAYYQLTKPGIIRGNAVTATAGYFLASQDNFHIGLFLAMLFGVSLVIASGCVFNNYLDQDIDKKMTRTKKRALVTRDISVGSALIFGIVLGVIGVFLLYVYVNLLTAILGIMGFIFYVIVYTPLKRKTVHGTLIGSISGAIPPVAGYTAVSQVIDFNAILIFMILVLWQMPHFYAISIYRIKEYKEAGIPVLPVVRGIVATKRQMYFYIVMFACASLALTINGQTGIIYTVTALLASAYWLGVAFKNSFKEDDVWAKSMFVASLLVLSALCGSIILEKILVLATS